MTQADAFAAGQATGSRAANTSVFNNINAATGAAKVDGYSSTPAERSYWGVNSPIAPVMTAGVGKISSCSGAPSSDPRIANQCEAINALNEQPSKRPPGLVTPTDPLIVSGDAITANPETIAGSMIGTYSACTTNEVSLGKETVEETCDEYSSTEPQKCTIGTQVTVDPDHLYKCKDSQRVEANSSCTIGRVITVDADANYQCTTTEKVHQQLTCNRTYAVTTARSYKGTPPDTILYSMTIPIRGRGICSELYQPLYANVPVGSVLYRNGTPLFNYNAPNGIIGLIPMGLLCGVQGYPTWYIQTMIGPGFSYKFRVYGNDVITLNFSGNCPASFTKQADKSCLSNDYQTNAANPACSLIGSSAASYSGLNSVTEYQFACKTMNDQCTGLAARAQ